MGTPRKGLRCPSGEYLSDRYVSGGLKRDLLFRLPTTITRDANGNISSVSSLLGGSPLTTQFTYDGANRLVSTISPGLSVIDFAYDANGNLVRLRPDGRPDHLSVYNFLDLEEQYEPPPVSAADPSSFTTYDLDRRPTLETRPDGSSIAFDYDLDSRLVGVSENGIPVRTYTFAYDALGNLVQDSHSDGRVLDCVIDSQNRRIGRPAR